MAAATSTPASTPPAARRARRIPSRLLKWGLLAVLLLAATLAVVRWATARPRSTVRYETVALDRGPLAAKVTATGTASALVMVIVGSQVSGRIRTIHADFGSQVRQGDTVATIDPSLFNSAVAQARANLAAARSGVIRSHAHVVQGEKDFQRAKELLAESLVSRAEYDAAEATLAAAKADEAAARSTVLQTIAALSQAEQNLRYTNIISPIDGVVISRNVDVGQTVAATLQAPTLFTIAKDLTRMQVDTNVAEADVGKIRPGMKVTFTVDAYPSRVFDGVVRQVRDNATTVQNVVTYDAVLDVDNAERLLKPGMTASVTFTYATRDDALRLPNAAIRFKPDAPTLAAMKVSAPRSVKPDERVVWLLRSSKDGQHAVPEVVQIGISDGASTEVLRGNVAPGDRVVVEASAADAQKRGP